VTFVKMCGITRREDAMAALAAGADALGFVFWPASPRYVNPREAAAIVRDLPHGSRVIGVFVDQPAGEIRDVVAECGLTGVQLHGDESASSMGAVGRPVIKAASLATAERVFGEWPESVPVLLDAHDPDRRGGTGQRIDWTRAAPLARRRQVVLAGGLTPENVAEAIAAVRPFGVDVSSGVEDAPGIKSAEKMRRFVQQVREASDGR